MQIGYANKAKKSWKNVQTTFFKKRNLSCIQDKSHVNQIGWLVRDEKSLKVKCRVLFFGKLKAIENTMDSLIYLSSTQAPNLGLSRASCPLILDLPLRTISNFYCWTI